MILDACRLLTPIFFGLPLFSTVEDSVDRRQAEPKRIQVAGAVDSLYWSVDSKTLIVQTKPGANATQLNPSIRYWNVSTGRVSRTLLTTPESIHGVALSPDGNTIACGFWKRFSRAARSRRTNSSRRQSEVRLWNTTSGKQLATHQGAPQNGLGLPFSSDIVAIAFSPDGSKLAGGSKLTSGGKFSSGQHIGGEVWVWNARNGKVEWFDRTTHTDIVFAVVFAPDGKTLASGGQDGLIRLWDVKTGKLKKTLFGVDRGGVISLAFSRDGVRLASGGGGVDEKGTIRVWDVATGKLTHVLPGPVRSRVAFGTGSHTLFSAGPKKGARKPTIQVRMWDLSSKVAKPTILGEREGYSRAIRTSPNGRMLAVGTWDGDVLIYNVGKSSSTPGAK